MGHLYLSEPHDIEWCDTNRLHSASVSENVDVVFFKYLKYTPMFDLFPTAKETIQYLMNKGISNWSPDSQNEHMRLYQTYMSRL